MDKSVSIVTDLDGSKIALINDIRFQSRRGIDWNEVEQYLKEYPDYNNKHGGKAKFGWYRYNTRFGIPVYDEDGNLERYNIFSTRMLVRCDEDGKLYLYDLVRTKKETSKPLEH
jgi:hypothetical protein